MVPGLEEECLLVYRWCLKVTEKLRAYRGCGRDQSRSKFTENVDGRWIATYPLQMAVDEERLWKLHFKYARSLSWPLWFTMAEALVWSVSVTTQAIRDNFRCSGVNKNLDCSWKAGKWIRVHGICTTHGMCCTHSMNIIDLVADERALYKTWNKLELKIRQVATAM